MKGKFQLGDRGGDVAFVRMKVKWRSPIKVIKAKGGVKAYKCNE